MRDIPLLRQPIIDRLEPAFLEVMVHSQPAQVQQGSFASSFKATGTLGNGYCEAHEAYPQASYASASVYL